MAAILRRGPSKWVRLLAWDTANDVVLPGAWLNGRIYENRCSVSPDGKLFAYFATKFTGSGSSEVASAWTAISKLPWLTALAFWPRSDTWGGRAQFVDDQTLIIDCPYWERLDATVQLPAGFKVLPRWIGQDAPPQDLPPTAHSNATFDGTCGVDQNGRCFVYQDGRLLRDDHLIVDLGAMQPDPQPPPDSAREW